MSDYDVQTRLFYMRRERAKKARDEKEAKLKGGNLFEFLQQFPSAEAWPELEDPPRPETQDVVPPGGPGDTTSCVPKNNP